MSSASDSPLGQSALANHSPEPASDAQHDSPSNLDAQGDGQQQQTRRTLDDCIEELIAAKTDLVPAPARIYIPGGDTWVFIKPPSKGPEQSLADYEKIVNHFSGPLRVSSEVMKASQSPLVLKQLSSPTEQFRQIRRCKTTKEEMSAQGIKYVMDLTPEWEGDEAVELTEELSCPPGIVQWARTSQQWRVSGTLIGGHDELTRPSLESDFSRRPDVPDYTPLRHCLSIERVLAVLHGQDPQLDSAPKVYTTVMAATRSLKIPAHALGTLTDYVYRWIRAVPNSFIVELHPEPMLKIADELQIEHLCQDTFAILVGEAALQVSAASIPQQTSLAINETIYNRRRSFLHETWETRVQYARDRLVERMTRKFFHDIVQEDMQWVDFLPEVQEVISQTDRPTTGNNLACVIWLKMLKQYIRGAIYHAIVVRYQEVELPVQSFRQNALYDHHHFRKVFNALDYKDRVFTRTFWKILRALDFSKKGSSSSNLTTHPKDFCYTIEDSEASRAKEIELLAGGIITSVPTKRLDKLSVEIENRAADGYRRADQISFGVPRPFPVGDQSPRKKARLSQPDDLLANIASNWSAARDAMSASSNAQRGSSQGGAPGQQKDSGTASLAFWKKVSFADSSSVIDDDDLLAQATQAAAEEDTTPTHADTQTQGSGSQQETSTGRTLTVRNKDPTEESTLPIVQVTGSSSTDITEAEDSNRQHLRRRFTGSQPVTFTQTSGDHSNNAAAGSDWPQSDGNACDIESDFRASSQPDESNWGGEVPTSIEALHGHNQSTQSQAFLPIRAALEEAFQESVVLPRPTVHHSGFGGQLGGSMSDQGDARPKTHHIEWADGKLSERFDSYTNRTVKAQIQRQVDDQLAKQDEAWYNQTDDNRWGYTSGILTRCLHQAELYVRSIGDVMLRKPNLGGLELDTIDTLVSLEDTETKVLPLWAGGLDDGSGGVFNDEVPIMATDEDGFRPGRSGMHSADSEMSYDGLSSIGDSTANTSKLVNDGISVIADRRQTYAASEIESVVHAPQSVTSSSTWEAVDTPAASVQGDLPPEVEEAPDVSDTGSVQVAWSTTGSDPGYSNDFDVSDDEFDDSVFADVGHSENAEDAQEDLMETDYDFMEVESRRPGTAVSEA